MAAEFDIPGRQFDFKKDLAFGEGGESMVNGFLESLSGGSFEVKTDRYRNGRMVVETNQNPRGIKDENGNRIWNPSGINITTAKWWVYIYATDGSFVIISVDRLKRYLRKNHYKFNENTKRDFGGNDNPARGFLVYPNDVMDMLANTNYDEVDE